MPKTPRPNTGPRAEIASNFALLKPYEVQLWRLGALAERYFAEDPNTSLLKIRQLAELLAQVLAARAGLYRAPTSTAQSETQYELIRRLQDNGIVPQQVKQLFDGIRINGNAANHALQGDHRVALSTLKLAWQLALWFHRTFKDPDYAGGPFIPPAPPGLSANETASDHAELLAELERLRAEVGAVMSHSEAKQQQSAAALQAVQLQLSAVDEERAFWEEMASEAEQAKTKLAKKLATTQQTASAVPNLPKWINAAAGAASHVQLDEADTRKLIDLQLRDAGWEADSGALKHSKGTRPQKGKNRAIAEWPCSGGLADYVLFVGLIPMAVVEAKRKNIDVSGALQQAKRYSRQFEESSETTLHEQNWGTASEFRIPFAFSSNGRPYLRQLETRSGIWFVDLRQSTEHSRALDGWYTPEGLSELLAINFAQADAALAGTGFDYGFPLRPYQIEAIRAVETALHAGQRKLLLAMATGTGKTKTCIALMYRLLKTQRFKRILFLVDRSALGEQAANAFKDTRMENLQTLTDAFDLMELDEKSPEKETKVHIATVQGMVMRVLLPAEGSLPPGVDQYDCIVVDECHRGYTLDKDMSDTEQAFRSFDDYISKYSRVLDYFDAVKIGMTATPALHTSQLFGSPVYNYSYREAVIDGFLVDYEPPYLIGTELSKNGIHWETKQTVLVYDVDNHQIDSFQTPDDIDIEVEGFNRKVITEAFNKVVCTELAEHLDPNSQQKTLIFCATDAHADMVVTLLKAAFKERYGSVDDDAVIKITGVADKPLELIRRFRNEHLPNVAVTVDLLTTGIDVPKICNLVFLRRVNSRILFDQMMGRATRLCDFDDESKGPFRVFDAVRLFEVVSQFPVMRPVVVDPGISFVQLQQEISGVLDDSARQLVKEQFLAKLQSKKRHLDERGREEFEACAGMAPDALIRTLKAMSSADAAEWFTQNPTLAEILDRKSEGGGRKILLSEHEDALLGVERGYGDGQKPQDYLDQFKAYISQHGNDIPALMAVLTRPRELTRKQLKDLALALDLAGFSETRLATAWRELTSEDIAARIVGYIRQAAIGDALIPYTQRVDAALKKMLANPPNGKPWSDPQRTWLKKIAAQTKVNVVVDSAALEDPDQIFKREGGGFTRLDRLFNGNLTQVLAAFNDAVWDVSSENSA